MNPERAAVAHRFGANLRRCRRKAGLSQQALADRVGMNRLNLGELERAQALPRIDTVLRLAAGADVPVRALLEGIEWRPGRRVEGDFYVLGEEGGRIRPRPEEGGPYG